MGAVCKLRLFSSRVGYKLHNYTEHDHLFCSESHEYGCIMELLLYSDLGLFGLHDSEQLLGNDRQHLNVDSVELIEAAPGA